MNTGIFLFSTLLLLVCCNGDTASTGAQEEEYIVGGREVYPAGSYPWQGSLELKPLVGAWYHNCGCVYVGGVWVLTAAHCVHNNNPENHRVLLGAHDVKTQIEGRPEYFNVVEYTQHPDWQYVPSLGFPNDIAVIRLDRAPDADDNPYIRAIAVPPAGRGEDDWMDMECVITGWGRLYGAIADLPNMLQEASIDVITQQYCSELWSSTPINQYHVCLLDNQYLQTGSCSGDSGGPLQCRADKDSEWELVGLTSWGYAGCNTKFPSVYAKVSYFSEWIAEITGFS